MPSERFPGRFRVVLEIVIDRSVNAPCEKSMTVTLRCVDGERVAYLSAGSIKKPSVWHLNSTIHVVYRRLDVVDHATEDLCRLFSTAAAVSIHRIAVSSLRDCLLNLSFSFLLSSSFPRFGIRPFQETQFSLLSSSLSHPISLLKYEPSSHMLLHIYT